MAVGGALFGLPRRGQRLPHGAIARGSVFSIFGRELRPGALGRLGFSPLDYRATADSPTEIAHILADRFTI